MKIQLIIIVSFWWLLACGVKGDPQPPEKSSRQKSYSPLFKDSSSSVPPTHEEEKDEALNKKDKAKSRRQ